jgi:hypothetical protein
LTILLNRHDGCWKQIVPHHCFMFKRIQNPPHASVNYFSLQEEQQKRSSMVIAPPDAFFGHFLVSWSFYRPVLPWAIARRTSPLC